eukprot:2178882-Ditylum_brightwellii.AAC.1
MSSNYQQNKLHIATSEYLEASQEQMKKKDFNAAGTTASSNRKCLAYNKDLNELVSRPKHVFITMPAKSVGTSLKNVVKQCMHIDEHPGNSSINLSANAKEFMADSLHLQKIIAGYSYSSGTLLYLL